MHSVEQMKGNKVLSLLLSTGALRMEMGRHEREIDGREGGSDAEGFIGILRELVPFPWMFQFQFLFMSSMID